MLPAEYRLDHVTARLIERLEGARRTFDADASAAQGAFEEIADEHVRAALAEYRVLALEDPAAHATFLHREVLRTALPRYTRLAVQMNQAEASAFGFGRLASPSGRLGLALVAAAGLWWLGRLAAIPWTWPLLVLDLCLPWLPSIGAWLARRRYRGEVVRIVEDMARIQDNARPYLTSAQLDAAATLGPPSSPEDP